ncbi:MFS general substrate transporter [Meredithblackwellia eburnea MCA 4105]
MSQATSNGSSASPEPQQQHHQEQQLKSSRRSTLTDAPTLCSDSVETRTGDLEQGRMVPDGEGEGEKGAAAMELQGEKDSDKNLNGFDKTDNSQEPIWVDWDGEDDPANPFNWSKRRKWAVSLSGIFFCALASMSVSGYAISQGSVQTLLHASHITTVLGVTMFTLTFGTAPLVLAPFSEVYGRNGIYLASAFIFFMFFIPQALAQNIETMLVSRFILGIAGSTAVSLVGGTLSDVFITEERGLPMAMFSYSAFASTGLGPLFFGMVEYHYNFRYVAWILFALSGAFTIMLVFVLKETRASVLLSRKAARLRKETNNPRYQARGDAERASLLVMIRTSLGRPIKMLFTEPVLFSFAVWIAFVWAVLYILLESVNLVFENTYGFNIEQSGFVFSVQVVGSTFGLIIDHYCDKLYHKNVARVGPEGRLYSAMWGGCLVPVGAFFYTFTSYRSIHWIAPVIGSGILYCGTYLVYLSCFNYLADSYTLYASSALSAQSFLRNLVGCVAPLFTTPMYNRLGIQGAGGLTAGIALLLSATPFILYKYGSRLRARSRFAQALERQRIEAEERAAAKRAELP